MNDEQLLNDLYYKKFNFDGANILFQKAKEVNKNMFISSQEFKKK